MYNDINTLDAIRTLVERKWNVSQMMHDENIPLTMKEELTKEYCELETRITGMLDTAASIATS